MIKTSKTEEIRIKNLVKIVIWWFFKKQFNCVAPFSDLLLELKFNFSVRE